MKFLKNICIRILIGWYFSKLLENLVIYFHIIFSVYIGLLCVHIYIYICYVTAILLYVFVRSFVVINHDQSLFDMKVTKIG